LGTVLVNFGQTFSFGDSNGIISCSYDVLVNITCWYCWCCKWALFWLFSCVTKGEPLQFLPKRELQSLIFGFGSRFSPRRPGTGLSDLVSHSGERYSPKRGCGETCTILSVTSRPGEKF